MTIYVIEKVLLHTLLCGSKKKKKATCVQMLCAMYILLARLFRHLSISFCCHINLYADIVVYKYVAKPFLYVIVYNNIFYNNQSPGSYPFTCLSFKSNIHEWKLFFFHPRVSQSISRGQQFSPLQLMFENYQNL